MTDLETLESTKYTFEEYERLVEELDCKIEYHAGYLRVIRGDIASHRIATIRYNRIQGNFFHLLANYFENKDAELLGSDQGVKIDKYEHNLYPDMSVTCGNAEVEKDYYLKNPSIVVEIIPKFMSSYDEQKKNFLYFSLSSLKEYITIHTKGPLISVHSKEANGKWATVCTFGLKSKIHLPNFNLDIEMTDIYRKVTGLNEEL